MYDLLTETEDAQAQSRGFSVEYVWDCKTSKLVVCILPLQFTPKYPHGAAITKAVYNDATLGDALCKRAVQLTSRGFVNPKPKAKK